MGIERAQLPPVHDYTNSHVGLAEPWATGWRELAETPFFLAVGDGVGANLGSGCTDNRRIALTIGTTGAMRVVIPTDTRLAQENTEGDTLPEAPAGLWSYPIDRHRWLVGGSLTDGGSLFSWLHEMLAVQDTQALLASAAQLKPDEHGLTILPFLRGERAPGWATAATLTISGLTLATTPVHIVRAAFEAVAYRFRLIFDRLRPHLAPDSIIVARAAARSRRILCGGRFWLMFCRTPVHLVDVDEATSRGAAVLGAASVRPGVATIAANRTYFQTRQRGGPAL